MSTTNCRKSVIVQIKDDQFAPDIQPNIDHNFKVNRFTFPFIKFAYKFRCFIQNCEQSYFSPHRRSDALENRHQQKKMILLTDMFALYCRFYAQYRRNFDTNLFTFV